MYIILKFVHIVPFTIIVIIFVVAFNKKVLFGKKVKKARGDVVSVFLGGGGVVHINILKPIEEKQII